MGAHTVELGLLAALNDLPPLSVQRVRVVCDGLSGASLGYAFIELGSAQDCRTLLQLLRTRPLKVEGKVTRVGYAMHDFSTL